MNTSNTPAIIRTLIIYAVCVPLAVWVGFTIAGPFDRSSFIYVGILGLAMLTPLLLRWHHFLMVVTWNLGMTIFFLPGYPPIWLLMVALSLAISLLRRTINARAHFLSAPSITWPLIFLTAVVLVTAKLTGGIGLHSLGNEMAGGRNYIVLLMGILGYFALTAQSIPAKRGKLYVSLFILAGASAVIGDLAPYMPSKLFFLFALFPVTGYDLQQHLGVIEFQARYAGLANLGLAGAFFMLARYGTRGIFVEGRLWRLALFLLFFCLIFFGGFRSLVILCAGVLAIQCYLERLHQTRIFPAFILLGLVVVTLLVPFAEKLPFTFQRSLAFLPLHIDPVARQDAESSKEWRLQVWQDSLETVPQYLLLGKGYGISRAELAVAENEAFRYYAAEIQTVEIVGNYHSGPLSTIIPFGIWGVIAMLWFWIASLRALYLNYRFGDVEEQSTNVFLLAFFIAKLLLFLIIFGSLFSDMYTFTAIVGLSISLNGGIRRSAPSPAPVVSRPSPELVPNPRFQPFYPQ